MQLPFGVIDADGHIVEDQARIREYMPEPYNGFLMDNLPDAQGRVGHGECDHQPGICGLDAGG